MENASKALIIAGAILISIVLIGVGVLIVSSANGLIGDAAKSMSQQEVTAFNAKFTSYEGIQNGTSVKALIQIISTHNITNTAEDEEDTSRLVQYTDANNTEVIINGDNVSQIKMSINSGKSYKVSFVVDNKTALIRTVVVEVRE